VEYSVHGNTTDDDVTVLVRAYLADYLNDTKIFDYGDKINAFAVSIPGLGHSSFHPGHQISQWPATDLTPILENENITGPFVVWGISLGTLYAMATAQHFGLKGTLPTLAHLKRGWSRQWTTRTKLSDHFRNRAKYLHCQSLLFPQQAPRCY
jgi:hypothetical protein